MRVEIEISDEEAAYLRKHVPSVEAVCITTDGRVLSRLTAALPRQFQVGDIVRWGNCTYPVLAVWRKWAWVGDDDAGPYDALLDQLILVAAAAEKGAA